MKKKSCYDNDFHRRFGIGEMDFILAPDIINGPDAWPSFILVDLKPGIHSRLMLSDWMNILTDVDRF